MLFDCFDILLLGILVFVHLNPSLTGCVSSSISVLGVPFHVKTIDLLCFGSFLYFFLLFLPIFVFLHIPILSTYVVFGTPLLATG